MAQYQSRNKLLLLSKKDLIKQCKKRNLNTFGCLAKMDFVKLLLNSINNKNNNGKAMKMRIKTRRKKKKTLSLSEPIPMPSPIDPAALNYVDFDDDDDDDILKPASDDDDVHNVQFSDLPWKLDDIKTETDAKSEEEKTTGIQSWDATSISPKGSKEIITILPGFAKSKSLQTVFTEDLKEADSESDHDSNEDDEHDNNHHVFVQIDKALAHYYKSFQRKDYFDNKGLGKFFVYCKDKKLDDMEEFEKYFGAETDLEPIECKYLDFDDNFPLNEYAPQPDEDVYDKEVMNKIEIYNVIEYCYQHRQSPY